MIKVYNKAARTFLLTALDGATMLVHPIGFAEIPEKYIADITYRRAVQAGDLQVFETTRQGDAIERAANDAESASESPSAPLGSAGHLEDGSDAEASEKAVATPEKPTRGRGKSKADDAE